MKTIALFIILASILFVLCEGRQTMKHGTVVTGTDGAPQFGRLLAAMSGQGQ